MASSNILLLLRRADQSGRSIVDVVVSFSGGLSLEAPSEGHYRASCELSRVSSCRRQTSCNIDM